MLTITDFVGGSSPTDRDADGVADPYDNCPEISNASQMDLDSDGFGDDCDDDTDGDGTPDASDDLPHDANEIGDLDSDGVGNNADLDDDGDGVSDVVDNCPLLANDQTDTDDDFLGDACDPDDDNDSVPDEDDSAPRDAKNRGRVLTVPSNAVDAGRYGKQWGDAVYYSVLAVRFDKDGADKLLHVRGYDIDYADEVAVYLNRGDGAGVGEEAFLGYLSPGANNDYAAASLWWLPATMQVAGENRIEFVQTTPGYIWGVSELGLYEPGSAFGNLKTLVGGDTAHADGFELHLPGNVGGYLLEHTGYDVDYDDEIGLDLNGSLLVDLPRGVNKGWSESDHLVLPADLLSAGDNLLLIHNLYSTNYDWGVRLDRLLPMGAELGNRLPGQGKAEQRPDAVRYLIPRLGESSRVVLGYYDVDFHDELEVWQDGASLGNPMPSADKTWGTPEEILVPAWQRSVIEIDNTYNPPDAFVWGVRIEGLNADGNSVPDAVDN